MSCRRTRKLLRRAARGDVADEARRHIESCPACATEARAHLLLRLGSEREIKAQGLMKQEPKDYVVADGDILHIKFSV